MFQYLGHATVVAGDAEEGRRLLQEARQGLTLLFAKVAALALTLLGEMARSRAGPEAVPAGLNARSSRAHENRSIGIRSEFTTEA